MARPTNAAAINETLGFDICREYRCDAIVGVPKPFSPVLDFNDSGLAHDISATITHIGLVLACSEHAVLRALIADATVQINIDSRIYESLVFAAFYDEARAQQDGRPDTITDRDYPIFSHSLPLVKPLAFRQGQHLDIRVEMPPRLKRYIAAEEHTIIEDQRTYGGTRSSWFIALGVRLIGERVRAAI